MKLVFSVVSREPSYSREFRREKPAGETARQMELPNHQGIGRDVPRSQRWGIY